MPPSPPSPESFETKPLSDKTQAEVDTCPGLPVAGATAPNLPSTPVIPAAQAPFRPLDFLPAFLVGMENGAAFHTSAGTQVLSSIRESDSSITAAQVRAAHEIVMQYSRPPGLSPNINLDRVQQFVVFLAEIVKFQNRAVEEGDAKYTAYGLGNAVAALQRALGSASPRNGK